jgi:glyoxalase family protein
MGSRRNGKLKLEGIHHVTALTADGARCAGFYSGALGLAPGPDAEGDGTRELTFLLDGADVLHFYEVGGLRRGAAGAGMVHRIAWWVPAASLPAWWRRLEAAGVDVRPSDHPTGGGAQSLLFRDPEGLEHELLPRAGAAGTDAGLLGLAGVRAYGRRPVPTADLLAGRLDFATLDARTLALGGANEALFALDDPPPARPRPGAGTVHHVAWSCAPGTHSIWRQRVIGLGARVTGVLEHDRYDSIYFREPSGVLFEIAGAATGPAEDARRSEQGEIHLLRTPLSALPLGRTASAAA